MITVALLALALVSGALAVGYGRLGVKDPGAGYNLKGLVFLIASIAIAFLAGWRG